MDKAHDTFTIRGIWRDNESVDPSAPMHRAYTAAEWKAIWEFAPAVPKVIKQLSGKAPETARDILFRTATVSANKLKREGFTLQNNGGLPLLRRHRDDWFDEIIFKVPTAYIPGVYSPVTVEIILSLETLREIRAKYSRSYMMVSPFVASANLGQLEFEPCQILWNMEHASAIDEIAERLYGDGLDWVESFNDLSSLEEKVREHQLPKVDDATALELMIVTDGRPAAARVVREWLKDESQRKQIDRAMELLGNSGNTVFRGEDPLQNLGVVCSCFNLLAPARRQ